MTVSWRRSAASVDGGVADGPFGSASICAGPRLAIALRSRLRSLKCPWLADAFEPRCDIHAVANNVVPLDQDVAEVHANSIEDLLRRACPRSPGHQLLDRDHTFDRSDNRGNSSNRPSPIVLTMRPPWLTIVGRAASQCSRTARAVPV
jgi:hypothetical protein